MKNLFEWMLGHPETIASIVCAIVSVVIWLFKKKPVKVVDLLKTKIMDQLPAVINEAENQIGPGNGEKKLQFVIDYFTWSFDQEGLKLGDSYLKFIKMAVEQILSTPQKK